MSGAAVTSHRLILQNDKRCLFGSTPLTTNEESVSVTHIHKVSLHTDGSLPLGLVTLHSNDMLKGGFQLICLGFLIDVILEWRSEVQSLISDPRLLQWVQLVPDDMVFMASSVCVVSGCALLLALLYFLIFPQSVLEIQIAKQACIGSYKKRFSMPVATAYKMYDAIIASLCI